MYEQDKLKRPPQTITNTTTNKQTNKQKKHLMIEKPLCTTIEDCREVLKLYENYPKMVWVGMEYRFIPSVSRCIQEVFFLFPFLFFCPFLLLPSQTNPLQIDKGTVGRVRMITIREHRFPFLLKVNNWNRFTENTGGTLVEKCCHFFDLFLKMIPSRPVRFGGVGKGRKEGGKIEFLGSTTIITYNYNNQTNKQNQKKKKKKKK